MNSLFEYLSYTGSVSLSKQNGMYSGHLMETNDQVTYEAATLVGLDANFQAAVEEYIDLCVGVATGPPPDSEDERQLFVHVSSERVSDSCPF